MERPWEACCLLRSLLLHPMAGNRHFSSPLTLSPLATPPQGSRVGGSVGHSLFRPVFCQCFVSHFHPAGGPYGTTVCSSFSSRSQTNGLDSKGSVCLNQAHISVLAGDGLDSWVLIDSLVLIYLRAGRP